jgi:hypothetical protein
VLRTGEDVFSSVIAVTEGGVPSSVDAKTNKIQSSE